MTRERESRNLLSLWDLVRGHRVHLGGFYALTNALEGRNKRWRVANRLATTHELGLKYYM
jgi:hypothetical protein